MKLSVIGLGVNSGDVSVRAFERIKNAKTVILRTERTQCAQILKTSGIEYVTLDGEYERSRNFDTLNKNLAKKVSEYLKSGDVCYLVEGAVSEDASCKILFRKHKDAEVFEGVSKTADALNRCGVRSPGYSTFSAYDIGEFKNFSYPLVVYDLDSQILASEWKLKLMDEVGEEQKVWLYIDKQPRYVSVYELDRFSGYDYSTVVIVEEAPLERKERYSFNDLYDIVKLLRAPGGCPWDRAQTKESIRKNLIEECYELCDAIDRDSDEKILEETGDVLLQAVFHIIFAEERGAFDKSDVFTDECKKLIFRHSHIFGKDKAVNPDAALDVWDKNKQVEKGFRNPSEYVSDVPKCFPSLLRTQKVIKRIEKSGGGAPEKEWLIENLKSVCNEFLSERDTQNALGKLLLTASCLAKVLGHDGEECLYFATEKLVETYEKDWNNGFDLVEYFKGEND